MILSTRRELLNIEQVCLHYGLFDMCLKITQEILQITRNGKNIYLLHG